MSTRSAIVNTLLISFLLIVLPAQSWAGTLDSVVNRNQISLNETLNLTVSYDAQVDSSSLDLSVLETEFEVLSSSPQSSNAVSVVNGKTTRQASTVWTILLAAKKTGTLTIPSFSIGSDRSKTISIEVGDGAQAKTATQPLQVWISADRDQVYPAQQIIVEIEISAQANVADLNGPQLIVNDAEVEPLGQQTFQRLDNGVARQIFTLKYAVFAKQAGELTIPIMTYTGIQGGRRSVFRSSGTQVVARSEQLTLTVSEPPVSNVAPFKSAPWFPAENVSIVSSWSGDKSAVKTGEPITRTISVVARGQRANIIPPIDRPSQSTGYKAYRDQPQLNSRTDGNGFVSTRTESEAIVVNAAGELTLPSLELGWWNVATQQWELATLPAETIQVSAAASSDDSSPAGEESDSAIGKFDSLPTQATRGASSQATSDKSITIWHWLTGLLLIICGVQTWLLFRLNRLRSESREVTSLSQPVETEREAWRRLKQAANKGDANATRQKLVLWARAVFPNDQAVSIHTLVRRADNVELGNEIEKLESSLYKADRESNYDSAQLLALLTQLRPKFVQEKPTKTVAGALPDLYPNN